MHIIYEYSYTVQHCKTLNLVKHIVYFLKTTIISMHMKYSFVNLNIISKL